MRWTTRGVLKVAPVLSLKGIHVSAVGVHRV